MSDLIRFFSIPLLAYLLGSIPFGLVFTRLSASGDIRSEGSGNIGATNVARTAGKFLGGLTLVCDIAKGAIPVWMAVGMTGGRGVLPELYVAGTAFCAFSGHLFPLFTRFRNGGKGVATAAGCFLILSPISLMVSLLFFILLVCLTERVSAGSLAASAILPLAVWKASGSEILTACAFVLAAGIFIRHRGNLVRLVTGREPALNLKVPTERPDQGHDPGGHKDRLD